MVGKLLCQDYPDKRWLVTALVDRLVIRLAFGQVQSMADHLGSGVSQPPARRDGERITKNTLIRVAIDLLLG